MISEIKLDKSFPSMQFKLDGCKIFRSDRHANGSGILVYVRDDIPCKLIPMRNSTIEGFFIELKSRGGEVSLVPFVQPSMKIYFQPSDQY